MTPDATPSSFIITPNDVTRPLPEEAFNPCKPLDVDIGCGKGRFLLGRAKNHPDRQILGIDRLKGRIQKLDGKLQRAGCTNGRLIRLEAFYSVAYLLPDDSVTNFFILFPDPWPKRRHANRRLIRPEFLETIGRKLKANGNVHLATDHLDYFAVMRDVFESDPHFNPIWPYQRDDSEKTDFEKIFRCQGLAVAEASYRLIRKDPDMSAKLPLPNEPRRERKPSR